VSPGTTIQFKVTRGSWSSVEKGPEGEEVVNRTAVAGAGPTTVFAHVFHWADDQILPPLAAIRDLGLWEPRSLGLRRQIYAHLPPGYDDPANASASYPVLYALDGQRMYDPSRSPTGTVLGLDTAGDANVTAGHGAFISIAIDSTFQRTNEFGPSYDPTVPGGGHLPDFATWLLEELKPEIDRIYRTQPGPASTAVLGTDLGALASYRLSWDHPDKLGLVGALSPLMGWNGGETQRIVASTSPAPSLRIWLDVGTNEGANPQAQLASVRGVDQALAAIGFGANDLAYSEVAGGTADDTAWAARLPNVLAWLFP
jgi:predicted alpha/beta superfamily hydrolase